MEHEHTLLSGSLSIRGETRRDPTRPRTELIKSAAGARGAVDAFVRYSEAVYAA